MQVCRCEQFAHIEVERHIRGRILVDGERCACVLDEEIGHPNFKGVQLLQFPHNVPSHDVAAPVQAREGYSLLNPAAGAALMSLLPLRLPINSPLAYI